MTSWRSSERYKLLHRPYDSAIDLLPGTTPPRGRLYSLSGLETQAMEEYIEDSQAAGGMRSSASPVFLCGKGQDRVRALTTGALMT